jgi:F-type H+-transporting ATPase subunit epsilon
MPLQVELVSPERIAYSGEANMVVCRTTAGDIAFQPGHVPFIGVLQTHSVKVIEPENEVLLAVHQGFVEVSPPDEEGTTRVTILSDVCELADAIDVDRARSAKERAEAALAADPDDAAAKAALVRAQVRIDVAEAA